jgi:hypothetical protein
LAASSLQTFAIQTFAIIFIPLIVEIEPILSFIKATVAPRVGHRTYRTPKMCYRFAMASKADQYRQLAHCRKKAAALPSGSSGWKALIETAQTWERLAYDHLSPPVQQQQQIQPEPKKE